MARPPRIEIAGAVYHVTARSDLRGDIYRDDTDYTTFLDLLRQTCERHDWICHAYCLMRNHYHLVLETKSATLSKGMKLLGGSYTQYFNRKYRHDGAIFCGRFKAIIVERNTHLLEVCRHVVTNPVRIKAVRNIKNWLWSSYRGTAGLAAAHGALNVEWILGQFNKQRKTAEAAYRKFVQEQNKSSPWNQLQHQIFLGSDTFVEKLQRQIKSANGHKDTASPKTSASRSLARYSKKYPDRNVALVMAYRSGEFSLQEVGDHFEVSYATVSRAVNAYERGGNTH